MQKKNNSNLTAVARRLRKDMTKEERHLWYDFLRTYPIKFRRQKVLGKYIADFYCAQANLVVELDGGQHYSNDGLTKDKIRSEFLEQFGVLVVRIPNNEISSNFYGVCTYIDLKVKENLR